MTKVDEIYKCEICGNIVTLLHQGVGELVCCNQPMVLQQANTKEAATEKHLPVVRKTAKGFKVTVGEIDHPMTIDHFIESIFVYFADGKSGRKDLLPGAKPEAEFFMDKMPKYVQAYCNIHGLWRVDL